MNNSDIFEWINYDNKIKEYNTKIKQIRDEREKLTEKLVKTVAETTETLPTYNITNMNTSLSFQKSNTYENYTKKFYTDCFTEFLGSEEKANELLEFMKKKRKVESKIMIKRSYLMTD
jgi:hypothetical protein